MGVFGLKRIIQRWAPSLPQDEALPAGCELLVDGLGLLHFVADKLGESLERHLGGAYDVFDLEIRRVVGSWREAGASVTVFFDGEENRTAKGHGFKNDTRDERYRQRSAKWSEMYGFMIDGAAIAPSRLPLPPLLEAQIRSTLAALEVHCVDCEGEADYHLALACRSRNMAQSDAPPPASTSKARAFIIGDDSDFVLFADCLYVPLPSLTIAPADGPDGTGGGDEATGGMTLQGQVLSRDRIARLLRVPPAHVVEVCVSSQTTYRLSSATANIHCVCCLRSCSWPLPSATTTLAPGPKVP